jgi:hypothetical protein
VKLRRHRTRDEVAEATGRLPRVLEVVVSVSEPYPDREARVLVRVDLEVRLPSAPPTPATARPTWPATRRRRP